jgi:hypothetical protein
MAELVNNNWFSYNRRSPPFFFTDDDDSHPVETVVAIPNAFHREYYTGLRLNPVASHDSVLMNGMTYGEFAMYLICK